MLGAARADDSRRRRERPRGGATPPGRPRKRRAASTSLVCSAGITGPNSTLADYPVDAWKRVFDVNVHGLFLCNRAVVPIMRGSDYGRIVNIASVAGKEGNPNASAYSASKAAVIALTKSLGKELASTGIRVNCVTPAAVRTAIFDQMTQQHIDFMLSKIPMGRFGTVEEIASLVCWLASEECSFSTGRGVRYFGRPGDVLKTSDGSAPARRVRFYSTTSSAILPIERARLHQRVRLRGLRERVGLARSRP